MWDDIGEFSDDHEVFYGYNGDLYDDMHGIFPEEFVESDEDHEDDDFDYEPQSNQEEWDGA